MNFNTSCDVCGFGNGDYSPCCGIGFCRDCSILRRSNTKYETHRISSVSDSNFIRETFTCLTCKDDTLVGKLAYMTRNRVAIGGNVCYRCRAYIDRPYSRCKQCARKWCETCHGKCGAVNPVEHVVPDRDFDGTLLQNHYFREHDACAMCDKSAATREIAYEIASKAVDAINKSDPRKLLDIVGVDRNALIEKAKMRIINGRGSL